LKKLRKMSPKKLREELDRLQSELLVARVRKVKEEENVMLIRNLRRNIARVRTIMRERELRLK